MPSQSSHTLVELEMLTEQSHSEEGPDDNSFLTFQTWVLWILNELFLVLG